MLCSLAYCEPKKNNFITTDPFVRKQDSQFVCKKKSESDWFLSFWAFFVFPCFFLFKIDLFFCRPECHAKRHFFISFFYSEEKMQTMTDQLLVDLYIKSEKNNKKLKKKKYLEFFLKLIFQFLYRSGNIGNPVRFCLSSFNQNGIWFWSHFGWILCFLC